MHSLLGHRRRLRPLLCCLGTTCLIPTLPKRSCLSSLRVERYEYGYGGDGHDGNGIGGGSGGGGRLSMAITCNKKEKKGNSDDDTCVDALRHGQTLPRTGSGSRRGREGYGSEDRTRREWRNLKSR